MVVVPIDLVSELETLAVEVTDVVLVTVYEVTTVTLVVLETEVVLV